MKQTASPALQKEIEPKELKEPKRLQQHKLLEVVKPHFKEFLGTLLYQIKHKTIKKLHTSQNVLKGKIAIFIAMKYISGAPVIWFRVIHYLNSLKAPWGRLP